MLPIERLDFGGEIDRSAARSRWPSRRPRLIDPRQKARRPSSTFVRGPNVFSSMVTKKSNIYIYCVHLFELLTGAHEDEASKKMELTGGSHVQGHFGLYEDGKRDGDGMDLIL
uniref:Uncharacterized protein n=1 Tax=Oryza brachyantha TaxID=4533 RepID=J3MKA7_ORYBR